MIEVTVKFKRELFSFSSQQEWVNKAKSWYANCGVRAPNYIAIDAAGRVCTKGAEFMRATQENTYPITVYELLV